MRLYRSGIAVLALALTSVTGVAGAIAAPVAHPGAASSGKTSSGKTSAALPALQVLTIGDSIMNGHGLTPADAWPYLVATDDGWSVTNDGCDGAGVLSPGGGKCNTDFSGIIANEAGTHPNIVIFEGSSNDFGEDNDQLEAATLTELQTIRAEFPLAQIVGLSTLWGSTAPPAELAVVNAQVEEAVTDVGGTYIDIGQPMEGHPELMQSDDVHPTAAGQIVLASTIETALKTIDLTVIDNEIADAARVARVHELVDLGDLQ
jgi:acyl-CoA thioesterase-1